MNNSLDRIITHLVTTLPDSLEQRMLLLGDALEIMPANHPSRQQVKSMLTFLASHKRQQMEFNLNN